jgi:hypothetical protein
LLSHLIRKGGKIEDLAPTIEPDIDADVRPLRPVLVRRDSPSNLVNVLGQARPFLIMDIANSLGILIEVVNYK